MNQLDGVLLILLGLGAFIGYRRGLFATIIGIGSFLGALAAAFAFYKALGSLFAEWGLVAIVQKWILARLPLPEIVSNFPSGNLPYVPLDGYLSKLPLPDYYTAELASYFAREENIPHPSQALTVGEAIANYLAHSVVNGFSYLIILLGVERLLRVLTRVYSRAIQDTLFGTIDRVGGLITGALLLFLTLTLFAGWMNSWLTVETAARYGPLSKLQPLLQGSLLWSWASGAFQGIWDRVSHFTFR